MKNTQKYSLLILSGAIAGAAATYFFTNTERGKRTAEKIIDGAKIIRDNTIAKTDKIKQTAEEKIDLAKEVISQSATKSMDKAEDQLSEFKKGIEKAREILENGISAN